MGQRPLGGILVLVARLQFILMRMAVGAKGLRVADRAGPALLLGVKPVPLREIARMVQRRPPVLVAVAAERELLSVQRGVAPQYLTVWAQA